MSSIFLVVALVGAAALVIALYIANWIKKNDEGSERMREIASYIRRGAMTFLAREYRIIAIFAVVMFAVLFFAINWQTAVLFLVGSSFSLLAGVFGMRTATNANVRTAAAARLGMPPALRIAFRAARSWA